MTLKTTKTSNSSDLDFTSLNEVLAFNAKHQPEKTQYNFISFPDRNSRKESKLTSAEFEVRVKCLAAKLQEENFQGERALLVYPPGMDYIIAFFACLYAGVVAVPTYPPLTKQLASRLKAIAIDSSAKLVLTTEFIAMFMGSNKTKGDALEKATWITTENIDVAKVNDYQPIDVSAESLAFLQYTSGSTSSPKGVMLTHKNILHNLEKNKQYCGFTPESSAFIWLPQYHDMGLTGGVLQAVYNNFTLGFMSPMDFLQDPYRWLHAMSDYKATMSGGPNFAYDLCVNKVSEEQKSTLDLRHWSVAANGAEPVRSETLERFSSAFSSCGFKSDTFSPGYGLAENTFFLCCVEPKKTPNVLALDAAELEKHAIRTSKDSSIRTRNIVSQGKIPDDSNVIIVNPVTSTQSDSKEIGEIWITGDSVGTGYWGKEDETKRTFQCFLEDTKEGPFLRTGDLGFIDQGELYITGRLKDLVIIRGKNHYPQDIELTVSNSHHELRKGCGAAFSVDVDGDEKLIILQEVKKGFSPDSLEVDEMYNTIRKAVKRNHEIDIHDVLLIKQGSIPKTSSGKIQRQKSKFNYNTEALDEIS